MDDSGKILSNKLNYLFLQLPAVKELRSGQGFLEQLAFSIRNIVKLQDKPAELKNPYFAQLFKASAREFINSEQLKLYDYMIRDAIQIQAEKEFAINKAIAKGREEGLQIGATKTARNLKAAGVDITIIAQCTGLPIEEVKSL